ncbi:AAA family ATPase [Mycobacterium sp. Y57]|nr:AAA family ATPase [Mycolicibacterium xanthum]
MTAADRSCASCGTAVAASAKFCSECGAPAAHPARPAEYKQVTVLFADVVGSMDIAARVGAERMREIMTELVDLAKTVVQRLGGTLDKFTGDGIMAVFGAPLALEDHAVRACVAALDIQHATQELAAAVLRRDGVELRLRVGLNSGQVIAGEIGSVSIGYTAIGDQVGMAQRMESVAPPGGVMLSASTARLLGGVCLLAEAELVNIKGAAAPVPAYRLLGFAPEYEKPAPVRSTLVGRELELQLLSGLVQRAANGRGSVVAVVGPSGIGKSRLVREAVEVAKSSGVEVVSTHCESHTSQIPFHAAARLFRAAARVTGLDDAAARSRLRRQLPDADPDDLLLLDDLLAVADPNVRLPRIDPDARRRRLAALLNTANLTRTEPVLYVIEDVHWIDEASESIIADVLATISQTPAMSVITYRPEYEGVLSRLHGTHTIALAALAESESSSLIAELLGPDPSNDAIAAAITSRVAGNPFFAEEMVRELAQRGVLTGERGNYTCPGSAEVIVPGTVQATIGARIDRLGPSAKRTLSAASVIGLRFGPELLTSLGIDPNLGELIRAELVDQVKFMPSAEFAFHHPLVRAVAYESQLKADRSEWHRRLAAIIAADQPGAEDENAALIAEHLEAAGELRDAYRWHMRAGRWSTTRDISAARASWDRARQIADALPDDDPQRTAMRIATRAKLCGTAWRRKEPMVPALVAELRELCRGSSDNAALAIGVTALALQQGFGGHQLEASRLAAEAMSLLESVADPALSIGAASAAASIRFETGHAQDVLRWAQKVVEPQDGDPHSRTAESESPMRALALVFRGMARWWLGLDGWRRDLDDAAVVAARTGPITRPAVLSWKYFDAVPHGVLRPDDDAVGEIEDALRFALATGEDTLVGNLKSTLGVMLLERDARGDRLRGLEMVAEVREMSRERRYMVTHLPVLEMCIERERARNGNYSDAIPAMRKALESLFFEGQVVHVVRATAVLVEALLGRGGQGDTAEADAAIERLAKLPDEVAGGAGAVWLLRMRALLARARGDEENYLENRDRYRVRASELGFEGHMKWAADLP